MSPKPSGRSLTGYRQDALLAYDAITLKLTAEVPIPGRMLIVKHQ